MKTLVGFMVLAIGSGCGGKSNSNTPCGINPLGECSGTVLTYCDPVTGEPDTVDCSMAVTGEPFSCGLVDSTVGYNCEAPAAGTCLFFDSNTGETVPLFCAGANSGCLINPSGASTCAGGSPPAPC